MTLKKQNGNGNGKAGSGVPLEKVTEKGYRSLAGRYVSGHLHGNSKYTPEYAEFLLDYFGVDYTDNKGETVSAGKRITGVREGVDLPTIAGFCATYGISRVTYHRWSHDVYDDNDSVQGFKYPDFAYAHEIVQCLQEDLLIVNGLKGRYNANLAKFVLNTYHDKVEKSTRDLNMQGSINITIDSDDANL